MLIDMGKEQYQIFNYNTANSYSGVFKKQICQMLEKENLITFDEQKKEEGIKYFEKKDYTHIIQMTALDEKFNSFYEKIEFTRLYKYSVPFFYEGDLSIIDKLIGKELQKFYSSECMDGYFIAEEMKDVIPIIYEENGIKIIKFVLQKTYSTEKDNNIDYRYTVLIYFDVSKKVLELRYDSIKNSGEIDYKSKYESNVEYCINWLKNILKLKLFKCNSKSFADVIKSDETGKVKIFRQMMNMGMNGSADLVASEETDFKLPFIGEIRALMDEYADLFNQSPEIREIIENFLKDKEDTASYPYMYLLWKTGVISKNFIVKITFQYFSNRYILMQHISENYADYRMERMNDAISYLAESGAITQGEEL